ncbi:MAG: phosphoribosylanthranilate isomerase [Saprospiraceae bacterium]
MTPRVKICCISSIQEARLAIQYGASAIGLVGHMPSGPGVIRDDLIFAIARDVPPPIATFLLTSHTKVRDIIDHHLRVHTSTIQIVDELTEGTYQEIRKSLPSVKIVQVIHVIDESSIEDCIKISTHVDAILLDSGNPNLIVKELGGTGRIHNWKLSRKIVESVSIPVFLAGGLNAENVRKAIDEVGSFGLDLCSGVRSAGRLDEKKLEKFMRSIL